MTDNSPTLCATTQTNTKNKHEHETQITAEYQYLVQVAFPSVIDYELIQKYQMTFPPVIQFETTIPPPAFCRLFSVILLGAQRGPEV